MVGSGDMESVKAAIALALTGSGFTDALAAVDTEKADGNVTPAPAKVYEYERAVIEAYPAAELQGLTTTYALEDDVKVATHRIAIVWSQNGDSEKAVTRQVERLVRATRDLLWRAVLGGTVGLAPMLVESEDYSMLAAGDVQPFVKGGRVIVAATTFAA